MYGGSRGTPRRLCTSMCRSRGDTARGGGGYPAKTTQSTLIHISRMKVHKTSPFVPTTFLGRSKYAHYSVKLLHLRCCKTSIRNGAGRVQQQKTDCSSRWHPLPPQQRRDRTETPICVANGGRHRPAASALALRGRGKKR